MFVVVASGGDASAARFVRRWHARGARLLSARDISTRGWVLRPGRPGSDVAVVEGMAVPVDEITAVMTRIPSITEDDVPWVVTADRSYVAAEATAFLLAWLSELPCPVLNPPAPTGLWGPRLTADVWWRMAAAAGMRPPGDNGHRLPTAVTVVGNRAIGTDDLATRDAAVALAGLAGVGLLTVHVDVETGAPPCFLGADYRALLDEPAVDVSVADLLQSS